jgi:primosomal protein N' (replication factor Y)
MEDTHFVEVAISRPLLNSFTYKTKEPIAPGVRVKIPFGRRHEIGVVLGPANPAQGKVFKYIFEIIDQKAIYSENLLKLAKWLSQYYIHPIGEVLRAMLPASQGTTKKTVVSLTPKGERSIAEPGLAMNGELSLKQIFSKKVNYSLSQFKSRVCKAGSEEFITSWLGQGLIQYSSENSVSARTSQNPLPAKTEARLTGKMPLQLSMRQLAVKDSITEKWKAGHIQPSLLFGVTGAGKTEIYLQLIAELEGQVLVLVPEIALTPQMTMVFEQRFPGKVAVVHSALGDRSRWLELDKIRTNQCQILIGPRSAIFANFSNLKLIIVDEEHDGSYKQATGLCYHGRDTAIVRAKIDSIPILLGSATPSLESWQNAITGKYSLERLEERIGGKELPEVKLIKVKSHLKNAVKVTGFEKHEPLAFEQIPIAEEIINEIALNLEKGEQSIILVNRRGYAYYLMDLTTGEAVQCPQCSISLTLHAKLTKLKCHYCNYTTTPQHIIEKSQHNSFVAIGYGSEKAQDILKSKFPNARIGRLDSDVASERQVLSDTLSDFREGKIDILVGTQMLAKGHDFPRVTLVVLLEVDQLLNLPDFRSGERTFQLLVQAAGRAGRHNLPGRVFVQSTKGMSPILRSGLSHNFPEFVEAELKFRKAFRYPPFSRMIALEWSSPDQSELTQFTQRADKWLEVAEKHFSEIKFLGPSSPVIETIRGRHRQVVVLIGTNSLSLNRAANLFLTEFSKSLGKLRLKVDVDPTSLL